MTITFLLIGRNIGVDNRNGPTLDTSITATKVSIKQHLTGYDRFEMCSFKYNFDHGPTYPVISLNIESPNSKPMLHNRIAVRGENYAFASLPPSNCQNLIGQAENYYQNFDNETENPKATVQFLKNIPQNPTRVHNGKYD